ncbi:rRNA methyltransferase 3, mitochondrial [Epargyreus clarus]|uniref:rRNA methyltransferase 3, mitochondrial n=1 Tax=Epargyreus clarus TaxID=520877 RepID=UPI003C304473
MMSRNIYSVLIRATFKYYPTVIPSQVRLYSRWAHRNPAKVILPFEPSTKVNLKKEKVISLDPSKFTKSKEKPEYDEEKPVQNIETKTDPVLSSEKIKEIKEKRETKLKKRNFYLSQKKVFDDNNEFMYEKLKENDGRVSTLLIKLKSKKERQRSEQMLVEGWRLIVDGLEAKCMLKYIFFSRTEDLNKLRPFLPKTGVVLYKIPYKVMELWSDVETPPGILGVFETPTMENIKRQSKPIPLQIICDNIRVPGNLGAILRAAVGVGCDRVLLSKGCVDLWDPKVIRSAAGAHFRQPIHSSVEWEEISKLLPKDTSVFIADSNARLDDSKDNKYTEIQMPVIPYYGVDFSQLKHVTLIIGGETEGISEDSYRLAESRNGIRLNIPLQRGVDSLNTGMAAAVIAFEIKKQYVQYWTKLRLEKQAIPAT